MQSGPSVLRREITRRRVESPIAANTGAASVEPEAIALLARDIALDVFRLLGPAAVVAQEGVRAPVDRDAVEARFDDSQDGAPVRIFQTELDKGHRLSGVRS